MRARTFLSLACAIGLAAPARAGLETNRCATADASAGTNEPVLTLFGIFDPLARADRAPSLVERLAQTHDRAFLYFNGQVADADAYFGRDTKPRAVLAQDSFFALELALTIDKNAREFGFDPGLDVDLAIPRIEGRLHAFLDTTKSAAMPGMDRSEKRDKVGTGLQAFLLNQSNINVRVKGGLKFRALPTLFGLVAFSKQTTHERWKTGIKQEAFWYGDDGFGEYSEGWLAYFINPRMPLYLNCGAKWAEDTWGVEFSQSLALRYIIAEDNRRGSSQNITARMSVFEHKNGPFLTDNYRFNVRYRRRLFRQWLYGEIMPQLEFPYKEGYDPQFSIELAVDILFFRDTAQQAADKSF